ncbi:MAG: Ig-like domain-containing protein [Lachnospiraceae bacterium]|nr:Ig-like domain-containing protein [Lachnospiraceae bacterium]
MKRKNYLYTLCICLIVSILLSSMGNIVDVSASEQSHSTTDNIPVVENPTAQNLLYAKGGLSVDEPPAISEIPFPTKPPVPTETPSVSETPLPAATETPVPSSSLPASYDIRNDAIITDIKDQGASGVCWAFSALKSAESNAIRKGLLPIEKANFSENHLAWFSFHASQKSSDPLHLDGFYPISNDVDAAYYRGGSALIASFTLARWSGVVMENAAPLQAANQRQIKSMANSMKQADKKMRYQSNYHLQNATCYDKADRNVIKEALLKKGALSVGFFYAKNNLQTNANNITTYYQNTYKGSIAVKAANHCVTIVGWDDNFSRNNFPSSCRPSQNGAWLIANSYGTSVGDQGYFWLSYYEPSICEIYSFEVEPADNYDTNYQYDGSGWGSAIIGRQNSVKAANIYTVQKDYHQTLNAIGLYTINDNQAYKIQIYTNSSKNKPTSGKLIKASTTSGRITYNGFHTIPLKQAVKLKAGTRFSVVITYSDCPTGINYMPIEGKNQTSSQSAIQTIYGSKAGQSFYYADSGKKWMDIAENGYNNLCVKAYAKNTAKAPHINITEKKIVLGKGESYRPKITTKHIASSKLKFRSSKPSVAKVEKNGKLHAKRNGTATITVSAGTIQTKYKVTVKKAPKTIQTKPKFKTLKRKQKYQIRTRLSAGSASHKLTFRSTASRIASVDKNGKITAKHAGTAVIKIKTYNNITTKLTIRVKK